MKIYDPYEVWFLTGSQHLYGPEVLERVAEHSREMVTYLDRNPQIPVKIVFKGVMTDAESIHSWLRAAADTPECIGLIFWMHTFSPARMWIAGLKNLTKPFVHLHTQYNRDLPWSTIDMDFMNLNQAAHGDREFGYLCTRLNLDRKIIVGHWQDERVHSELATWMRAAAAWRDGQEGKIARFGDNMRDVAVTEGDKVAAQIEFGYVVNGYGVGELAQSVAGVTEAEVDRLVEEYMDCYDVAPSARPGGESHQAVRESARIELGLRRFLAAGGFTGFTTTFEDLHGLRQLPGLAVQRLMAEGYGFGAEGDWKTAALVRALKFMARGLPGGTSFMEDYTYHLLPGGMKVLGAHMLEVCPSLAQDKPRLEVHPLAIGGKADPARLVFNVPPGPALNVSLIDLGARFRLVLNEVDTVAPEAELPHLPVARAVWVPRPNLIVAAQCWILAGGAHHTAFSQALNPAVIRDFATIARLELVEIGPQTTFEQLQRELRWNAQAY